MKFDDIPLELSFNILKYLDIYSIINLSMVNKKCLLYIKFNCYDIIKNCNNLLIKQTFIKTNDIDKNYLLFIHIIKNEYYTNNYYKLFNLSVPFYTCRKLMYLPRYKINKIYYLLNNNFICYEKLNEICMFRDDTIKLMLKLKNDMKSINKPTFDDLFVYFFGKEYEGINKDIIDDYIEMNIPLDIIYNIIKWPYIKKYVFKNIIKVIDIREAHTFIEYDFTIEEINMIVKLIDNNIIESNIIYNISNYNNEAIDIIIKYHSQSAHLKL